MANWQSVTIYKNTSPLGTVFEGRILKTVAIGEFEGIVAQIRGNAQITVLPSVCRGRAGSVSGRVFVVTEGVEDSRIRRGQGGKRTCSSVILRPSSLVSLPPRPLTRFSSPCPISFFTTAPSPPQDANQTVAQALAIDGDRIIAVGSDAGDPAPVRTGYQAH